MRIKKGIIYKYTSPSGKIYIGQTWHELRRKSVHRRALDKTYFHNAIKKYGFNNFKYEIIFDNITCQEELNKLETEMIKFYNSFFPNGYNLTTGGTFGRVYSDVSKKKISESNKGRKFSDEIKKKFSEAHLGIRQTEESKIKISNTLKGRKKTEEHNRKVSEANKGKIVSQEAKNNLSKSHIGVQAGEKHPMCRKVKCLETGIIYPYVRNAAREHGVTPMAIINNCKGKTKSSAKLHWEYV